MSHDTTYWLLMFSAYVMPVLLIAFSVYLWFAFEPTEPAATDVDPTDTPERRRFIAMLVPLFLNFFAFSLFCDNVHGTALGTTPKPGEFHVASSTATAPVSERAWIVNLVWGAVTWLSVPLVGAIALLREFTERKRLVLPIAGGVVLALWTLSTAAAVVRSFQAYARH